MKGIMKKVTLMRYWLRDRADLPVYYVKQAERQLKHLATLVGPDDGDPFYYLKQWAPTHRTIYEDLIVRKYLRKLQASSFKLDSD